MSKFAEFLGIAQTRRDRLLYLADYDRKQCRRDRKRKEPTAMAVDLREPWLHPDWKADCRHDVAGFKGGDALVEGLFAKTEALTLAAANAGAGRSALTDSSPAVLALDAEIESSWVWLRRSGAINVGHGSLADICAASAALLESIGDGDELTRNHSDAMYRLSSSIQLATKVDLITWLKEQRKISVGEARVIRTVGERVEPCSGMSTDKLRTLLRDLKLVAALGRSGRTRNEERDEWLLNTANTSDKTYQQIAAELERCAKSKGWDRITGKNKAQSVINAIRRYCKAHHLNRPPSRKARSRRSG